MSTVKDRIFSCQITYAKLSSVLDVVPTLLETESYEAMKRLADTISSLKIQLGGELTELFEGIKEDADAAEEGEEEGEELPSQDPVDD